MKCPLPILALAVCVAVRAPAQEIHEASTADALSAQATDPTASLMAFNLLGAYTGGYHGDGHGLPDETSSLTFRPVVPFTFLDHPNLLRLTVPYQLGGRGEEGFGPISAGDLQYVYDWEASQWLSAPVGFQVGKVLKLGDQPIRLAANPQYNLIDRDGLNEWSITFTFTALFPSF